MDQPPFETGSISTQDISSSGMLYPICHNRPSNDLLFQATEVLEVVEKDPKSGFTLVLQLTGTHGSHQFDKITKTKTVESILAKMDSDGIKEYFEYLLKQVNDEDNNSYEF